MPNPNQKTNSVPVNAELLLVSAIRNELSEIRKMIEEIHTEMTKPKTDIILDGEHIRLILDEIRRQHDGN